MGRRLAARVQRAVAMGQPIEVAPPEIVTREWISTAEARNTDYVATSVSSSDMPHVDRVAGMRPTVSANFVVSNGVETVILDFDVYGNADTHGRESEEKALAKLVAFQAAVDKFANDFRRFMDYRREGISPRGETR